MRIKNTKGFTLVEILIVVIILGILAAIIIPQFSNASQDAKASSLTSGLQTLRSQAELYKVQHNDMYPWENADGSFADSATVVTRLEGKTASDHAAGGNLGPYFPATPRNPFVDGAVAFAVGEAAGEGSHWVIDTTLGTITAP